MQKNTRFFYFFLITTTILLGILSRKIEGVPTFLGDSLYAVMVYFGVRMFFLSLNLKKTAILALSFCFCIEFLQLYRADWMLEIRRTALGHYVLGQDFLWSDLGFYTLGVLIAFGIDFNLFKIYSVAV